MPEYLSPWEAVLGRLEEGIDAAVRSMEDPMGAPRIELWSPPDDLGPLPEELRGRTERLIEAQRALLGKMESRLQEAGGQISALRQVPGVGESARSLYLDVSG